MVCEDEENRPARVDFDPENPPLSNQGLLRTTNAWSGGGRPLGPCTEAFSRQSRRRSPMVTLAKSAHALSDDSQRIPS
jgi:hypothetical protein